MKTDGAVTPLDARRTMSYKQSCENSNLLIYNGRAVPQSNRSDTTCVLMLDTSKMFMS